MKIAKIALLLICFMTASLNSAELCYAYQKLNLPAALATPDDQQLVLILSGRGVQIYKCIASDSADNKFEWKLVGPEAELFDAHVKKVGRHFIGPTWQLDVGDKLVAKKIAQTVAPYPNSVPWLLLEPVEASGKIFAFVNSIQRIATTGGAAPSGPTAEDVGREVRVPYTAEYWFYAPKSANIPPLVNSGWPNGD